VACLINSITPEQRLEQQLKQQQSIRDHIAKNGLADKKKEQQNQLAQAKSTNNMDLS
jgi:hypothetical protein